MFWFYGFHFLSVGLFDWGCTTVHPFLEYWNQPSFAQAGCRGRGAVKMVEAFIWCNTTTLFALS